MLATWLAAAVLAQPVVEKGAVLHLPCEDAVLDKLPEPDRRRACRPKNNSDNLLYASFALHATSLVYLVPDIRDPDSAAWAPAVGHASAFGLNLGVNTAVKLAIGRQRPYTFSQRYADGVYSEDARHGAAMSFYSGHTSNAAVTTFSMATTYALHGAPFEGREAVIASLYAGSFATTFAMGRWRVKAGKHFRSDVWTGGFMGALFGIATPIVVAELAKR